MLPLLIAVCFLPHQLAKIEILDPADEALRPRLTHVIEDGVKINERFFGKPYAKPFVVTVYPSRSALDQAFHNRWGVNKTEPWMVAAGVADGIFLLSPRVWKTDAAEHNPDDAGHVERILTHELTHVYHGQLNPFHDFEGMDDLAWLAEGLATYVSGQLDVEHKGEDAEALTNGKGPMALATAWSGRYRYAVSGSLVRYLDRRYGRAKLIELLKLTTPAQVMSALGTTEADLLQAWKQSIRS